MSAPSNAMELQLEGIRVVEASAGTGKTFTIATLYLRLILERGLTPDQIVVATFTRAAAAELSERLRRRLVIADTLLAADADLPLESDGGECAESRKVIAQALASGLSPETLRTRARDARLAIDTATIGTLHSFCHRVLAEFGFETGQALRQPELIDDIRELETEIVRDFWRRGSASATKARLLADTWGSPEKLAAQACNARWGNLPEGDVPQPVAVDTHALEANLAALRATIANWGNAELIDADQLIGNAFNHASARKSRSKALRKLRDWARADPDEQIDGTAHQEAHRFDRDVCADLGSFLDHPEGPWFDNARALDTLLAELSPAREAAAGFVAAALLCEARAWLESEVPRRLVERNLMGHDQAVERLATALSDPARGAATTARIRARWKAALIDEFQDTDARQWQVVHTLFGETTLVLVGDPKQAIYGFRGGDVFAWLEACRQAQGDPLHLRESWRAGEGMARATNALFSRPDAFIEAGIDHTNVQSAEPVAKHALLRDGELLHALQLWWLDPDAIEHAEGRLPSKAHAVAAIQAACVAWIVKSLADPTIRLRKHDGTLERLQPQHIAVLVNSNHQAHAMQAALGRAGVPASSNLHASVYTSDEAADLSLLLDALASADDVRRARAAHASVLVGIDAASIAASVTDDDAQAGFLEAIAGWADSVRRHGPLPWLHSLLATAGPQLLALPDGERRTANYLQLAELLQDLHAQSFGLDDLAARFARARVEAADDVDTARLRLDTDADAVTVSTVHAAKGLEYEVVLVPYAVLAHDPHKSNGAVPLHWYHDGDAARVAIGKGAGAAIIERAIGEIRAEEVRKFYVAVTRAAALCVLPWGPVSSTQHSPVFHLLHRAGREQQAWLKPDKAGCQCALEDLCSRAPRDVQIVELPKATARTHTSAQNQAPGLHAREFTRTTLETDWQTWSFSRLVRGSANQATADPLPGSGDADRLASADDASYESGLAGARFGTAVHAAFERTDFATWRDATGVPESERNVIEQGLRAQGLAGSDIEMQRALDIVGACIRAALNAPLPCGTSLCDVRPGQRKAEIEFHLTLSPAHSTDLYTLLHRHGYQRQRSGIAALRLHGLLTGKIDLTFAHAGRFHIVDWKTNRCAPYDDAALRVEIAAHDYDLQWLVYTLALHRWLHQQLPDYDYDRHIGETYYLFVRGMVEGTGIHTDRPPRALIEAMDALFGAGEAGA